MIISHTDYDRVNETYVGKRQVFGYEAVKTETGDVKTTDAFQPQVKMSKWENEVNFSIRPIGYDPLEPTIEGSKLISTYNDSTFEFYFTPDGYEFSHYLHSKPRSPVIEYSLQHKGIEAHYQTPHTPEELAQGYTREAKYEGSYAFFHATKRNHIVGGHNYKWGKAFHLAKPWIEDSNKWRVWCDLHVDMQSNRLYITIPDNFYAKAVFPALIDPTFGYTGEPSSSIEEATTYVLGQVATANIYESSTGDTATTFHAWTTGTGTPGARTAVFTLYEWSGAKTAYDGSSRLFTPVTVTAPDAASADWVTTTISEALTDGYKNMIATGDYTGGWRRHYDSATPGFSRTDGFDGDTPQAIWSHSATGNFQQPYYVTYTTGAGGGGRVMSSMANHGGLVGMGGLAGQGGGLAG